MLPSVGLELKVHIVFDAVASLWRVGASEVPGLYLDDDDPITLVSRVRDCGKALISLNLAEIMQQCRENGRPVRASDLAAISITPVFSSIADANP